MSLINFISLSLLTEDKWYRAHLIYKAYLYFLTVMCMHNGLSHFIKKERRRKEKEMQIFTPGNLVNRSVIAVGHWFTVDVPLRKHRFRSRQWNHVPFLMHSDPTAERVPRFTWPNMETRKHIIPDSASMVNIFKSSISFLFIIKTL